MADSSTRGGGRGEAAYSVVPRAGRRLNYVDAAREFARHVTVRDDPPRSRPRDITWLDGNNFAVEGVGVCRAEEVESSPGVFAWRIRVATPVVTVARPENRVPMFPDPADDHAAACGGLAEKMTIVSRLIDEVWEQVDPRLIGPDAYAALESSGKLETFHRRSGTVSTALADMARILAGRK